MMQLSVTKQVYHVCYVLFGKQLDLSIGYTTYIQSINQHITNHITNTT